VKPFTAWLIFLLLKISGADELQGIKRGIMEMADAIVINKMVTILKSESSQTGI
jgi:putative protein kinase ArgK-like GTPase of G3E family